MKCFNPKVIGGLVLAGLAVFLIAPSAFSAVVPLLVVAACPLGMFVMMKGMSGGKGDTPASNAGENGQAGVASESDATEAELARLRAEIDQLKAADRAAQERRQTSG